MDILNFAFVKSSNVTAIENAIILINRSRHQQVNYRRIIRTSPRRGWTALIIDSATPDHYLMRNLSGRLSTQTFEFGVNGVALYYRIHNEGRTVGAYESHLALWVAQQLRMIISTADVTRIDLAEPAGRLILQRYHEHQRTRAWTQPSAGEKIAPVIEQHYIGQASQLKSLLEPGTDLAYVQEIINPGFSAMVALDRLINILTLPYLKGEPVVVPSSEDIFAPSETEETLEISFSGDHVLKGVEILTPKTWSTMDQLPKAWSIISYDG
jgi:hypothetical protein